MLSESLSAFTDAADSSVQRTALTDLVKERRIHEVASDELFVNGLKRLADSVRDASSRRERLLTVDLAVKWRSLQMRGTVGQEVEFSPVEHRFMSDGVPTRRVRLLSPLVERLSEDGIPRVVLKAAVEPTAGQRPEALGASA